MGLSEVIHFWVKTHIFELVFTFGCGNTSVPSSRSSVCPFPDQGLTCSHLSFTFTISPPPLLNFLLCTFLMGFGAGFGVSRGLLSGVKKKLLQRWRCRVRAEVTTLV